MPTLEVFGEINVVGRFGNLVTIESIANFRRFCALAKQSLRKQDNRPGLAFFPTASLRVTVEGEIIEGTMW